MRTIALLTACSLLWTSARPLAQQPPPAVPRPQSWLIDVTPEEGKSFDQALDKRLEAAQRWVRAPRDGPGHLLDPNDNQVGITTVRGLILVRDAYVSQLNTFADALDQVANETYTQRMERIESLLPQAAQAKALYGQMERVQDNDRIVASGPDGTTINHEFTSRSGHDGLMRQAAEAEKAGNSSLAASLRQQAQDTNWGQHQALKHQYFDLIAKQPLLGLHVDGKFLWEALVAHGKATGVSGLLGYYARQSAANYRAEAKRAAGIRDLEELIPFGSDQFEPQHRALNAMGEAVGSERIKLYVNDARGAAKAVAATGAFRDGLADFSIAFVVSLSMLTPVGWVAAGAAGVYGLYTDGSQLFVVIGDAEQARQLAAINGMQAVYEADTRVAEQTDTVIVSTLLNGVDIAEFAGKALRIVRVKRATDVGDAADAAAAARRGAANAPPAAAVDPASHLPAGAAAEIGDVADAGAILNRLDDAVLSRTEAGDAAFFTSVGVVPERTIKSGGRTWHVSKPFVFNRTANEPYGRVAIVAFEETVLGTIVPRTFYMSNSHGIWKVAPNASGSSIGKGPQAWFRPNSNEPWRGVGDADVRGNQGSVDAAAELQKPLSEWMEQAGRLDIPSADDANRAARGHLDGALDPDAELYKWMTGNDIFDPLTPDMLRPDFAAGPKEAWSYTHPMLGQVEAFTFGAESGDALFTVLRDGWGRVWVPSIQDAWAGVTPLGNRWSAFDAKAYTTIPFEYADDIPGGGLDASAMIPGDFAKHYDYDPNYLNPLNEAFRKALPAPGSVTPTPQPRIAPPTSPAAAAPAPSGASTAPNAARGAASDPSIPISGAAIAAGLRVKGVAPVDEFTEALKKRNLPTDPDELRKVLDSVPEEFRGQSWHALNDALAARVQAGAWDALTDDMSERRRTRSPVTPSGTASGTATGTAPSDTIVPGVEFRIVPGGSKTTDEPGVDPGTDPNNTGTGTNLGPRDVGAFPIGPMPRIDLRDWNVSGPQTLSGVTGPLGGFQQFTTTVHGLGLNNGVQRTTATTQDAEDGSGTAFDGWYFDGSWIVPPFIMQGDGRNRPGGAGGGRRDDARFDARPSTPQRAVLDLLRALAWPPAYGQSATAARPGAAASQAADERPPILIALTSLGRSTGEAFRMTVINTGTQPVRVGGDGFVLEPVAGMASDALDRVLASLPKEAAVTRTITAYCLEFAKQPPGLGMIFRIAPPEVQRQYARVNRVLDVTRRLRDAGQLIADGGSPRDYVDSIRQWAIWTLEQNFDERRFADAFVAHTRRNVLAAGRGWAPPLEQAARGLVPGRWKAIRLVMQHLDARPSAEP